MLLWSRLLGTLRVLFVRFLLLSVHRFLRTKDRLPLLAVIFGNSFPQGLWIALCATPAEAVASLCLTVDCLCIFAPDNVRTRRKYSVDNRFPLWGC
jgi:hypothetical protein